jgi:hypothetical protein
LGRLLAGKNKENCLGPLVALGWESEKSIGPKENIKVNGCRNFFSKLI